MNSIVLAYSMSKLRFSRLIRLGHALLSPSDMTD